MCIGIPSAQQPQAAPAPPRPLATEELTAKTADSIKKAGPTNKKKSSFRRKKSGGKKTPRFVGGVNPAKSLTLKPKSN